ncbi:hypothetical protein LOC68_23055 [Blastopirellula sp. JC732]|uniref:Uncharacterized protein n=1 Tax=Blastopirellula sediminis TaxID=2894196 RepID=A0A9X1MQ39_9BACT|nr:hypothetical protein [Blastopirellula sediminis]MCC9605417.1 hypothetical protein [Blastopirellula sediminis]MCC9631283.1 hypothetical protein [Blastopirellula sediminis]
MSDRRQDYAQAIQFALQAFEVWRQEGYLSAEHHAAIAGQYRELADNPLAMPPGELPLAEQGEEEGSLAQEFRYLTFLDREIDRHLQSGRLDLEEKEACQRRNRSRGREVRAQLNRPANTEKPAQEWTAAAEVIEEPQRSFLEVALDPKTLQYLMAIGGGLLMIGLVIWLATIGFFDDPLTVAICLGAGNLAILLGGVAMIRWSKFQTAGRGVALLSCLLMPLHLWFYDAQGLIVLNEGGHLWIPALVICMLYVLMARQIRDAIFVYVVVGGATLTGLLILADQHVAQFWQGAAAASLLMAIAAIAIHAERAFPVGAGDFSRDKFGRASFRAGQILLLGAVSVLVGWCVAAWCYQPLLVDVWHGWFRGPLTFDQPLLADNVALKTLALFLSVGAIYLYAYSHFMVERSGKYLVAAIISCFFAELIFLDLLPIEITPETLILAMSCTSLLINAIRLVLIRPADDRSTQLIDRPAAETITHALAVMLLAAPLVIGIFQYLRIEYFQPSLGWSWTYVVAMVVTAVSCRFGAHVALQDEGNAERVYFIAAALSVMLATIGGLALFGLGAWHVAAPIMVVIPVAYLLASRFYPPRAAGGLEMAAHLATGLLLAHVILSSLGWFQPSDATPIEARMVHLRLAIFFGEVCCFYLLAARLQRQAFGVYLATVAGILAAWQALWYADAGIVAGIATFAAAGLVQLGLYRWQILDRNESKTASNAMFMGGNLVLSLAGAAGILYALNRLPLREFEFSIVGLMLGLSLASLVGAAMVAATPWRRGYLVLALCQLLTMVVFCAASSKLLIHQKVELAATVIGALVLIASHVGWYREDDKKQDEVSLGLWIGSLLFAIPMTVALLWRRFQFAPDLSAWGMFHEIGVLAIALILVGVGLVCRVRGTTITGGVAMLLYFGTLLCYVQLPSMLQNVAVTMMIGGGAFFGIALVLSLYRDTLIALPERAKRHEGVFKVLSWR